MQKRIAFIITEHYEAREDEKAEIAALFAALAEKNVSAQFVPAADLPAQAGQFDAATVLTATGYYKNAENFLHQLEAISTCGIPLFNTLDIVRWNFTKKYLGELERAGVPTLDTVWMNQGQSVDLLEMMEARSWRECVVKPVISAGAYLTRRIALAQAVEAQTWLEEQLQGRSMIAQPFASEITEKGEWSLVFFGGVFSHAVIKTPREGDYRIQHYHGGQYEKRMPPPSLKAQAEKALCAVPGNPVYARVDGLERAGRLMVMEIELLEPYLYLLPEKEYVTRAAEAFAGEIAKLPAQAAAGCR